MTIEVIGISLQGLLCAPQRKIYLFHEGLEGLWAACDCNVAKTHNNLALLIHGVFCETQ